VVSSVVARLRTLIEANERHKAVDEFHWKTSEINVEEKHERCLREVERLQSLL
jgi:hypothetical protein